MDAAQMQYFWLRQEPRESQCPFVHSLVRSVQRCLELSIFIFLALIFKQSVSNQSAVSQQSVIQLVIIPSEPKILRLVL